MQHMQTWCVNWRQNRYRDLEISWKQKKEVSSLNQKRCKGGLFRVVHAGGLTPNPSPNLNGFMASSQGFGMDTLHQKKRLFATVCCNLFQPARYKAASSHLCTRETKVATTISCITILCKKCGCNFGLAGPSSQDPVCAEETSYYEALAAPFPFAQPRCHKLIINQLELLHGQCSSAKHETNM